MDNLDKKIKDSKNSIKESNINNPGSIYSKANIKKGNLKKTLFSKVMIFRYLTVLLLSLTAILSILLLNNNSVNNPNEDNNNINNPVEDENNNNSNDLNNINLDGSVKFSDASEIRTLLMNSSNGDNNEDMEGDVVPPADAPSGDSPSGGIDHEYETNNQVEGVDEADIVKVNGDYIYYVTQKITTYGYLDSVYVKRQFGQNALYILKANGDSLDIIKTVTFPSKEEVVASNDEAVVTDIISYTPLDILYTDKYVVLSVSAFAYSNVSYNGNSYKTNYRNYTEFFIYNTNDYTLEKKVNVPGYIKTTRMIDNNLYVISNYNDYLENDYENCIPNYGLDDTFYEASLDSIYYYPSLGANISSYLVVFRISLNEEINIESFYLLSPYINDLYVNKDRIYLIKRWGSLINKEGNKITDYDSTKIIIISIDGSITYEGVVEVKGDVSDRYWLDEHNGYLRVATTGNKNSYKMIDDIYKYDSKWERFNYLTIFGKDDNNKWCEISAITEGLGEPGESMKSARFNGNKATIVTFKQTDPLYYVDLTDPYNPVITSELKISGFSVYQHPYKDNYVIGIGYEADEDGRTTGYKVALFDITDKNNIQQVGNAIVFSNEEYYTPYVLRDPKELFLDLNNGIFGFKMVQHTINTKWSDTKYQETFKLFKIDLNNENPLSIILSEDRGFYESYTDDNIRRMVFIKDKYYLLGLDEVYIYQLNDLGVELIKKFNLIS